MLCYDPLLIIMMNRQTLSLDQRLQCRKTVESVYWQHRIWPTDNTSAKPAFDTIMPDEIMRAKVEDELRKSNALELLWKRELTGAMLQAEIDRIARDTKKPELIQEIWEALVNNPYLVAECFARPLLIDRLTRNWE